MVSDQDGVFLVHSKHVDQYVERYQPQCLRSTVASGKEFALDFMNFKVSKGATFERVEATLAAAFYVAATRAMQSMAIVVDKPGKSKLPVWMP